MIFPKKSNKIFIDSQGVVKGLHCSFLDKVRNKIGTSTVERASSVEFDDSLQQWVATIYQTGEQFYSNERDAVLELEKIAINKLIVEGRYDKFKS